MHKKISFKNFVSPEYNLSWFGKAEDEGRTEEPTARKLQKAREKGDVAQSQEIGAALTIFVCFSAIYFLAPYFYNSIVNLVKLFFLNELGIYEINDNTFYKILKFCLFFIVKVSGPIMVTAVLTALIAALIQVGFLFSTEKLKFDIKKISISPKKFFEKVIFSKEVAFNLLKSLFKLAIVSLITYFVLKDKAGELLGLIFLEPYRSIIFITKLAFEIIIKASIFLIIFAALDFKFQHHQFKDKLKMTKQEVKDEFKQMEGDPQIKGKIREKQREAVRRRMMQEVPNADMIVRNPTHFAVAIKYDQNEMSAPVVIAKGAGYLALKIIDLAEESDVPIVTNKVLARTLYSEVEIGDEVPVEMYKTVAELLAYVWKLKGKTI